MAWIRFFILDFPGSRRDLRLGDSIGEIRGDVSHLICARFCACRRLRSLDSLPAIPAAGLFLTPPVGRSVEQCRNRGSGRTVRHRASAEYPACNRDAGLGSCFLYAVPPLSQSVRTRLGARPARTVLRHLRAGCLASSHAGWTGISALSPHPLINQQVHDFATGRRFQEGRGRAVRDATSMRLQPLRFALDAKDVLTAVSKFPAACLTIFQLEDPSCPQVPKLTSR